jgi:hypothetical protein
VPYPLLGSASDHASGRRTRWSPRRHLFLYAADLYRAVVASRGRRDRLAISHNLITPTTINHDSLRWQEITIPPLLCEHSYSKKKSDIKNQTLLKNLLKYPQTTTKAHD